MSMAHLHVLDTESGQWMPATSAGLPVQVSSGASAAREIDWSYAAESGGINDTSDVTLAADPGANNVIYLTALQLMNSDASVSTEVVIKSGSTVLWRIMLEAGMLTPISVMFPQPLRSDVSTALTAACITTAAEVYVNAQGYSAVDVNITAAEYGTLDKEVYDREGNAVADRDGSFVVINEDHI